MTPKILIEKLNKYHKKESFDCGVEELNKYLKLQAKQDMEKFISVSYVASKGNDNNIMGYYTLSAYTVNLDRLPTEIIKKLPRYPLVPAILIGRLAINKTSQGTGLGEHILMDALRRSHEVGIGSVAVIVDAKDNRAKKFYQKYDFQPFHDNQLQLFLPLKKIGKLFE